MVKKAKKKVITKKKSTKKVAKKPAKSKAPVKKAKKEVVKKAKETKKVKIEKKPEVIAKVTAKKEKKSAVLAPLPEVKHKCIKCTGSIDKFILPFEGKYQGLRIFKCPACSLALSVQFSSVTGHVESIKPHVSLVERLKQSKNDFLSKISRIKELIEKETDAEKLNTLKRQLKKESDLSAVVDNEIDLWHDTENSLLLHEFLGLEYPQWKLFASRKKCIEEFADLPIPADFVPAEDDKPIKNKKGAKVLAEEDEVEDFNEEEVSDDDDDF